MLSALVLLTLIAAAPGASATAPPDPPPGITGAASPLLPGFCVPAPTPDDPSVLQCSGLVGTDVFLAGTEADRRVSLGSRAGFAPALPGEAALSRTLDWRILANRPIAAILRYRLRPAGGGEPLLWFVVLKPGSPERPGCVVALVDGDAETDGGALAIRVADARAVGFRCGVDPAGIEGRAGEATRRLGAQWLGAPR